MYLPFESLSPSARIWLYPANRSLTAEEVLEISSFLQGFTNQWTSHSQPLLASYHIFYERFIALAVDESHQVVSGCAIDNAVRAIRSIEERWGVILFDRLQQAFWQNNILQTLPLASFKQAIQKGEISPQTIVFQHSTLQTKADLSDTWQVPLSESWLKKYLISQEA